MVDPTSDLNENISPEDAPTCETCESSIVDSPDHRVITWIENDTVESAHFCNESCRLDWNGNN